MTLLTLDEAKGIKEDATQEDIMSIEVAIRNLTNNNFFREVNGKPAVRFNVEVKNNTLKSRSTILGLRVGDRIKLSNTAYNDELLTVKEVKEYEIEIEESDNLLDESGGLFITLVQYPADVKHGAKEILKYKEKMADKVGLKSVSIARVTQTYYDVNKEDNVEGLPASVFSFIDKYRRLSWRS